MLTVMLIVMFIVIRGDLEPEINTAVVWVAAMVWVAFNPLHLIADRDPLITLHLINLILILIHTLRITNLITMVILPVVCHIRHTRHTWTMLDQNHVYRPERIEQWKRMVLGMRMMAMDEKDFGVGFVVEVDVLCAG